MSRARYQLLDEGMLFINRSACQKSSQYIHQCCDVKEYLVANGLSLSMMVVTLSSVSKDNLKFLPGSKKRRHTLLVMVTIRLL